MTIGIGATGENAGLATWRALNHVERIASGSISGFATFAVITADGEARQYTTQRGGSETLFTEGDSLRDLPPPPVQRSPVAGVISSGPDRPEPLTQFLPVDPEAGLVTGHRFPNALADDGTRLNERIVGMLEEGHTASDAVERVAGDNPETDAGFVAVDTDGGVGIENTDLVGRRPDVSRAIRRHDGACVAVLNNAIHPGEVVTNLAVDVALGTMTDESTPDHYITVPAGVDVEHGEENRVVVEDDTAVRVHTTDEALLTGRRNGAVPYLGSSIVEDGSVRGRLLEEANAILEDGDIVSLSGKKQVKLGVERDD